MRVDGCGYVGLSLPVAHGVVLRVQFGKLAGRPASDGAILGALGLHLGSEIDQSAMLR